MLVTDLFIKPITGFIAVSPTRADTTAERLIPFPTAPAEAARDDASLAPVEWAGNVGERPTWQSPAGAGVRKVEAAIVGGICAFFAFGLAGTLGLF